MSRERLPFTGAYLGSMIFVLYSSLYVSRLRCALFTERKRQQEVLAKHVYARNCATYAHHSSFLLEHLIAQQLYSYNYWNCDRDFGTALLLHLLLTLQWRIDPSWITHGFRAPSHLKHDYLFQDQLLCWANLEKQEHRHYQEIKRHNQVYFKTVQNKHDCGRNRQRRGRPSVTFSTPT